MNLHHLEVFHAVAERGSVSLGAERLLISQPAVSKQLGQLERSLAVKLFDRHPRGVRLTAAGEMLRGYADRIFALSKEAERSLDDLSALRRGSLAIGCGPTVGVYLLPGVWVEFRSRFPGIRLRVETVGADVLGQRLLDGVLDFGLTELAPTANDLEGTVFMTDVLVPIASPKSPVAKRRTVRIEAFCHQPFFVRETGDAGKSLVERTLAKKGIEIHPVLAVGSTEAIKQAVAAGLGVAMVSRLAVRAEVAAGQLVEVKVPGLAIRYPIHHVRRRGSQESKAAKAFLELAEKVLRS